MNFNCLVIYTHRYKQPDVWIAVYRSVRVVMVVLSVTLYLSGMIWCIRSVQNDLLPSGSVCMVDQSHIYS